MPTIEVVRMPSRLTADLRETGADADADRDGQEREPAWSGEKPSTR